MQAAWTSLQLFLGREELVQLSVITATCQRPAFLSHVLQQFRQQSFSGIQCEHIVVSDGPDRFARVLAKRWGARYLETDRQQGHAGAFAKDFGIAAAQGEHVCFWDDDNLYFPHAVATLWGAAQGVEMGVVRVEHRLRRQPGLVTLPRRWNGRFQFGDIDTMCVCVRKDLASRECWGDFDDSPGTDYRWFCKLAQHQPKLNYLPVTIGIHL